MRLAGAGIKLVKPAMEKDVPSALIVIDAARRLLADASARCLSPQRDSEESIHEVRKTLKKVRAYWRLMRVAVGKRRATAGNARCSEAARQLASARDLTVMRRTLDELDADRPQQAGEASDAVRDALHGKDDHAPAVAGIDWALVAALLADEDLAWSALDAGAIDGDDVGQGRRYTRRKARQGYRRSRQSPDAPTLHTWRKWAKRWLYQEQLLHPGKAGRIAALHELDDRLGRHHDMAVLLDRLERSDESAGKPLARLQRSIRKGQRRLAREAMMLGRRLFD